MTGKAKGKLLITLTMVLVLICLMTVIAFAKVNVRLANEAHKFDRLMTSRFLKGYHLLNQEKIVKEGKGKLGGDCSITKVYYSISKKKWDKLVKEKKQFKSDATMIVIYVDIYPSKKIAKKKIANIHMKKAEPQIGDGTWTGLIKVDTRLPEQENNYNSLTLIVLKSNVQIKIQAINYKMEPGEKTWKLIQEAAKKLAAQVK